MASTGRDHGQWGAQRRECTTVQENRGLRNTRGETQRQSMSPCFGWEFARVCSNPDPAAVFKVSALLPGVRCKGLCVNETNHYRKRLAKATGPGCGNRKLQQRQLGGLQHHRPLSLKGQRPRCTYYRSLRSLACGKSSGNLSFTKTPSPFASAPQPVVCHQ